MGFLQIQSQFDEVGSRILCWNQYYQIWGLKQRNSPFCKHTTLTLFIYDIRFAALFISDYLLHMNVQMLLQKYLVGDNSSGTL